MRDPRSRLSTMICRSQNPQLVKLSEKTMGTISGEHQFVFRPVILKEQDEVRYVDHKQSCPRPFLEEPEKIGQGAYAIVYKVRIEKGHLTNNKGVHEVGPSPPDGRLKPNV